MSRLESIKRVQMLERRKVHIENILKDMDSRFFKGGWFKVEIGSNIEHRNYKNDNIVFDNELFKKYLMEEVQQLESEINRILAGLVDHI